MKKEYDFEELSNKYTLSLQEGSAYFRLGEKRIRALMDANPRADWLLNVGNRRYLLRPAFEKYLRGINNL